MGALEFFTGIANSRILVGSSKDRALKVLDGYSYELKEYLPRHADEAFSRDWAPDGQNLISWGRNTVLKLWRCETTYDVRSRFVKHRFVY